MSQKFYSEVTLETLNNATTDTDRFLVGDSGTIKYRTGSQLLSDLGITPGVASDVQNLVKAGVAINKGQAVYVTGADGTNIIVGLASNTSEATSSKTLGLLNATVAINGMADVVQIGRLTGLNTIGATVGDPVWLGVNGNLIYGLINKPYAPAHLVFLGVVTRVNSNNGEIFINVQNGFELNEIHDVDLKTTVPINGDVLGYNGTLWVNKTIAQWLGYTPANAGGTTNYVSKFTGATTLGNSLIFDNGTNVGIGTTSPNLGKLQVQGNAIFNNATNSTDGIKIISSLSSSLFTGGIEFFRDTTLSGSKIEPLRDAGVGGVGLNLLVTANNSAEVSGIYSNAMTILPSGNVGIGTTSPNSKLEVVGKLTVNSSLDGDVIANIINTNFNGYGSRFQGGGGNSGLYLAAFNDYAGNVKMIIDGLGNVGIGTTTPATKLNLNGGLTGNGLFIQVNGVANTFLGNEASWLGSGTGVNTALISYNSLILGTNDTERMRITAAGNVGIGTTTPTEKVDIRGGALRISNASNDSGVLAFGNYLNGAGYYDNGIFRSALNSIGTPGNTLHIGSYEGLAFTTSAAALGNQGVRMYISGSSGYTGINTTNPQRRLDIVGDHTTSTFRVYYPEINVTGQDASVDIWASEPGISFNGSGIGSNVNGQPYYGRTNTALGQAFLRFINGNMMFHTSTADAVYAERMRIDSAGNIAIGTTSTGSYKLYVNGGQYGTVLKGGDLGVGSVALNVVKNDDSSALLVRGDGNVGIGTTDVDSKLKVELINVASLRVAYNGTSVNYYDANENIFRNGAGAERMRITSDGNVGIGTTTAGYRTQIETNSPNVFLTKNTSSTSFNRSYFYNNNNIGTQFLNFGSAYGFGTEFGVGQNGSVLQSNTTSAFAVGTSGAYPLFLGTNGTERMRITSSGNVGIGTTSPNNKLDIVSSTNGSFDAITVRPNNLTQQLLIGWQGIATSLNFTVMTNGSERMRITSSGNVGIGTTAPVGSALLELKSDSQGFLPPRMNTRDRNNIDTPVFGLMIYNTDDETINVFTSSGGWRVLQYV